MQQQNDDLIRKLDDAITAAELIPDTRPFLETIIQARDKLRRRTVDDSGQAIPKTLEEAARRCYDILVASEGGQEALEESKSFTDFVGRIHSAGGMWMRNNWGLWSRDTELHDAIAGKYYLSHADDMSGMILRATWQWHKTGKLDEKELDRQAAYYLTFWAKTLTGDTHFTIKLD